MNARFDPFCSSHTDLDLMRIFIYDCRMFMRLAQLGKWSRLLPILLTKASSWQTRPLQFHSFLKLGQRQP